MTKGRIILCICAVILVALLVLGFLWARRQQTIPEETTVPTTEAPTTEATTQPTTQPVETTEAEEKNMYWVFAYGGLWVRSGPSTEYTVVGSLEDGDTVEVLEWKDGWAYIEKPIKGWCSGSYIHKLGWYKNVKTPEGRPVEDGSLKGKWVHVTTPVQKDGVWTCTAGIYRLRSDGTFIHRVDEYERNEEGKWIVVNTAVDHPYWVGEYNFDGAKLELFYMAELAEIFDKATGEPTSRAWVEWKETVTLEIAKASNILTVANAVDIPVTVANEHAANTEKTLYKASSAVGTPEDVCAILQQNYG
jgi:hypothetical protein